MSTCACGSGRDYDHCCGPVIAGGEAETAEALMRSRYSAYVVGDIEHLKASLHPKKRYAFDEKGVREWAESATWLGLEIHDTEAGGETDDDGEVEFTARFRAGGSEHAMRERARFKRLEGRWYYVSGKVRTSDPVVREAPKVGRNAPCPCGSGKKYKKCCA